MSENHGPLMGLKVGEFAGIGPGPHVAMLLADLGAQVVTIARPGSGGSYPVVERARHCAEINLNAPEGLAFA